MRNRTLKHIFVILLLVVTIIFICTLQYSFQKKKYNVYPISRDNWTLFDLMRHERSLFQVINPTITKYPYNGPYVHENRTLCSSTSNLTLLVLVLSSASNFEKRQTLRNTWANRSIYESFMTVRFVYLLGNAHNKTIQDDIDKEITYYGDIVQGNFIDSYDNLTHKSTMGFRWASERCRNTKYVIKTDDDVVINLFKLFHNRIFNNSNDQFHVYCHRKTNIIIRNADEKWYVGKEQLRGFSRYPPYCIGLFVMVSNDIVPSLYELLTWSPFFVLEDVLIYGFVLRNIGGLKYKQIKTNEIAWDTNSRNKTLRCLQDKQRDCPISVYLLSTTDQIVLIWESIVKVYTVY